MSRLSDRLKVDFRLYPQPNGDLGLKVGVTVVGEPAECRAYSIRDDGSEEVIATWTAPDTQLLYGGIFTRDAIEAARAAGLPLPMLVEGGR